MKSVFGFFVLLCVCLQFKSSLQHAIPFPCELNVTEIAVNVPTRIYFRMFDLGDGSFINDTSLAVYHARKMHVVLISSAWSTFQHIHPQEFGNLTQMSEQGFYYVDTTFPNSGSYMMNVDFTYVDYFPVEGYCQFVINVTGNVPQTPPTKVPLITSSSTLHVKGFPFQSKDKYSNIIYSDDIFSDSSNSYDIKIDLMTKNANYIAYWYCTMIDMYVSQNGSPVVDMSPYLNAQVHAVFVHEGSDRIWHTHGMDMNMTGMSCDIDVGWNMLNYTEKPAFGPQIGAYIVPELPGRWQGFLQMAHKSEMVLASFQFDVYIDAPNITDVSTSGSTMNMTMSEMTMSGMTMGTSSTGEVMNETVVTTKEWEDSGDASRAAYSLIVLFICIILLIKA